MDRITRLEQNTIATIKEACQKFENMTLLWSGGKDSTVLLWLVKKAFEDKVPFPVIGIDTGYKFKEILDFRKKYSKKWKFKLIIAKSKEKANPKDKINCCSILKTKPLQETVEKKGFKAVMTAIRKDEHPSRANEAIYSKREGHMRVHPILEWTELDIWLYTKRESIPVSELYFSKKGKRFRSLGCAPCSEPIDSEAHNLDGVIREIRSLQGIERMGRSPIKEKKAAMQRLRQLGYM